ncbi:antibiotic biosynthesis monooxygenase [Methylobacterium sp. J-030]|uniref:antibiotic biosynthesis monooxygenase family protein n=1 Tax=Methylobacterium sp. J-030 TaxID=2836627 RepID=UPI001FBAFFA0|nr:antibiotic biosynthesis monooxygenase family protein [Methylobacterium sp. J-030]MCJ2074011.1 antibiotic biosynthesis monooxygenase [Methylobacterium sp. J-030]
MPKFVEMGRAVTLGDQLKSEEGPVVLINTFVVSPEDADRLLEVWTGDAGLMKAQPGFISTQLHRGIAGSGVFLNYAVWQSVAHFRSAFSNPEFQAKLADYPEGVTISPHLFTKVEIPGICTA